jgi:hypothetical protein
MHCTLYRDSMHSIDHRILLLNGTSSQNAPTHRSFTCSLSSESTMLYLSQRMRDFNGVGNNILTNSWQIEIKNILS